MEIIVIIYSGGMDSFTLLNDLFIESSLLGKTELHAISFNYGQRHDKEIVYAGRVCNRLGITHKIVDLCSAQNLFTGSSLTSGDIKVPEGHYEEESMKQTVVPNRNMMMLSVAAGYALSIGAGKVYYGAHSGDHAIYPDCRQSFINAMNETLKEGNYSSVLIKAPYINCTKGDIAVMGRCMDIDYAEAWTCYNGRDKACSKCGACQERIEAMEFAGITDPMEYE